jgi:hypothetical protein
MGPAIFHIGQDTIGIGGEPTIGKKHRLDPLAQLFVCQKQQVFPEGWVRHGMSFVIAKLWGSLCQPC